MKGYSRREPLCTKTGFVLYSKDGTDWKICYPDGDKRYGGVTAQKLGVFFLALAEGMSIDDADDYAFNTNVDASPSN